jgi:hypothetical protein
MALESTQPLTEMITRNLPGGKGRPALKADNLTAICEPDCLEKMWEPRHLTTVCFFSACYRDSFAFLPYLLKIVEKQLPFIVGEDVRYIVDVDNQIYQTKKQNITHLHPSLHNISQFSSTFRTIHMYYF